MMKKTTCPICPVSCGIYINTNGTDIIKIIPDKSHVVTKGYICERVDFIKNRTHNRVTSPLKKIDGKFVPITWDVAIEEIANKIQSLKDNNEGHKIFLCQASSVGKHMDSVYNLRFLEHMGLQFITNLKGIEHIYRESVYWNLFGPNSMHVNLDVNAADTVLLLGKSVWMANHNPNINRRDLVGFKKNNVTLITVDPVTTKDALLSDYFLKIKPGTDSWLLAAIIQIIFKNQWENKQFINSHIINIQTLVDYVNTYNINQCSEITGIGVDVITNIAKIISSSRSFAYVSDVGLDHSQFGHISNALLISLMLIVNGISAGSMKITTPLNHFPDPIKFQTVAPITKHEIRGFIPASILSQNLYKSESESFKLIYVEEANPLNSYPDKQKFKDAFNKVDMVVTADIALTETAEHSDYVLPTTQYHEDYLIAGQFFLKDHYFHLYPPVFSRHGDSKSRIEITNLFIEKLNLVDPDILSRAQHLYQFDIDGFYEYINQLFEEGYMLTRYLAYKTIGAEYPSNDLGNVWHTFFVHYKRTYNISGVDSGKKASYAMQQLIKTGKFQFADYQTVPKGIDFSKITEFLQIPDIAQLRDPNYQFVLSTGGKYKKSFCSGWGDNDYFFVEFCSADAESLGISEGDSIEVSTKSSTLVTTCVINDKLQPGYIRSPNSKYANFLTGGHDIPVDAPYLTYANPKFKYVFANVKKV